MEPFAKRECDVVVIGAGVIGLAVAWRLAQTGLRVVAIDRYAPGAGASGVAAGMLAPVTEADFGEQALLALNLAAAERWPSFAAELVAASGVAELGYERAGALVVAVDRDDAEEISRLHEFQRSLGLDSRRLTRSEARALEPRLAPGVAGAVLAEGDAVVDPRQVVRALAIALDGAGGELVIGVDARLESDGSSVTGVSTQVGEFGAPLVVLCAGAWSTQLDGRVGETTPAVRPVKGQIVRLRASRRPVERVVRTPRCYVIARASGEVVLGATTEDRGFDLEVTAGGLHQLLESAREVLPDLLELDVVETGAGLRPTTPDNLPLIGPGAIEGLLLATGHNRNGVLLAPTTAEAIAGMAAGGTPPTVMEGCAPGRFRAKDQAIGVYG